LSNNSYAGIVENNVDDFKFGGNMQIIGFSPFGYEGSLVTVEVDCAGEFLLWI